VIGADAFGAPGIAPTFAAGDKDAVTTALGTSRMWATVGGGVLNEVFWPNTGRPQLRDLGFLVTGPGFWTEVKRVADYTVATPDPAVPLITVVHHHHRYQLTLDICCDPRRDCVVMRYRLDNPHPELGDVSLHVLAAPHLGGDGHDNDAYADNDALVASRDGEALAIVDLAGFSQASAGYVGASDGWQDCAQHGQPTWSFARALRGNVALTGSCMHTSGEIAVACATTIPGARGLARASLIEGYDAIAAAFNAAWRQWASGAALNDGHGELDIVARTSAMVLKVHEDLTYPGAIVASLATPWGFAHDDRGGYHLVWPRDCCETGLAMVAIGLYADARKVLEFLASNQSADGHWPQNFTPDGDAYWSGIQLDETALPVIFALKLHELGQVDLGVDGPLTVMIERACRYLAANAPVTMQDRWEETAGISPFSLAAVIAALAGAAEIDGCLSLVDANQARSLADWWHSRIDDLVYVSSTPLDVRFGIAGHYVRIGLAGGGRGSVQIPNRGGDQVDVSELVGLEFLALVRFGLRAADDARITDTVAAVDAILARDLPTGRYYYRYQDDGYGERDDASPFDGAGRGRLWPLLSGERGHYALDAGADPVPYLQAMAASRSRGGLIPEQVWDSDPVPERRLALGRPTGSASPLVWAHAEYLKLHAAYTRGVRADLLGTVADRYRAPVAVTVAHLRSELDATVTATTVVIESVAPFTLHVGVDGWKTVNDIDSEPAGLALHAVTLPDSFAHAATINWTRFDRATGLWEGVDHLITRR
jgi:glucoamylase